MDLENAEKSELQRELQNVLEQEARLVFPAFDPDTAWAIGVALREAALAMGVAVAIDIRLGEQILFFHAMTGTGPGNADWARRKRNLVELVRRSSYGVGLQNRINEHSVEAVMGLPVRDYASHGGCFPVRVDKVGHVGTITVSGLPQRDDHYLVVEVVAAWLGRDVSDLMTPDKN